MGPAKYVWTESLRSSAAAPRSAPASLPNTAKNSWPTGCDDPGAIKPGIYMGDSDQGRTPSTDEQIQELVDLSRSSTPSRRLPGDSGATGCHGAGDVRRTREPGTTHDRNQVTPGGRGRATQNQESGAESMASIAQPQVVAQPSRPSPHTGSGAGSPPSTTSGSASSTGSPPSSSSCSAGSKRCDPRSARAAEQRRRRARQRYNELFTMHGTTMIFLASCR